MFGREEIVEEGVVESCSNGTASVRIIKTAGCESCSARELCSSGKDNNLVPARTDYNVQPGDEVRIAVPGRNISSASSFIYGIPLLLIICGLTIGHLVFTDSRETSSALISLLLIAIYSGMVYFYSKKKDFSSLMPRIIFVKKK